MDVVLYGNDGPIAVLELKVSADEHGYQLKRYQQFAHEHGARCYMVDLEGSNSVQRERWEHIDLVDAFACFASSPNVTAREFGSAIAAVLQQWQTQMAGAIARMDSAVVPIVLRQVRKRLQDEGYETYAGTTAAGQPMLTAFQPHPSGQDRAFLCVDLRCQDKSAPTTEWLFRVGVQVDRGEHLADDRKVAHDLATRLAPALTLADLRASLAHAVGTEIAAAVEGTNPLKSPKKAADSVQRWLEAVDAAGDGSGPRHHPIFHNDWGRRLAAQFTLDPSRITPDSLIELVTATLGYLNHAAEPNPVVNRREVRTSPERRERYLGCLLGGAVGDALGAPVEFMSRDQILKDFGAGRITQFAPAYGGIGTITDDTQMTLFTAEGLLRSWVRGCLKGMASAEGVTAHAYLRWLQTQGDKPSAELMIDGDPGWLIGHRELHHRRAPGNTCLSSLRAMSSLGAAARNNSKGCGGVMRVAPAGLFIATLADRDPGTATARAFEIGDGLAALTHGHPTGHLAAGAFAGLICSLVAGTGLREALDSGIAILGQQRDHEEVFSAITSAVALADSTTPHTEAISDIGKGWVADEALAIAVYASLVSDSLEQGVTIAVNHDGDSDSTGAIAGNLLGALYGVGAIPEAWLGPLELREVISEVATDLVEFSQWDLDGRDGELLWHKYPGF